MSWILVADDETNIRQLLRATFSGAGYQVIEATDGEQALTLALAERPDIALIDVMMPVMDGYTLARKLRDNSLTAVMPIIMLTALQGEQDELKAFQNGVDDFITKPFSIPVLRARVTSLLARYGTHRPGELEASAAPVSGERVGLTVAPLDDALGGGFLRGSNILITGRTGAGKSSLSRRFIAAGLKNSEHSMVIALDDEPKLIRNSLSSALAVPLATHEQNGVFRMVDAYSWSQGNARSSERFTISGILELNQLAGAISDASVELGQSVSAKAGGRRVIDSISSLFVHFDLAAVQRFLAQLARTALSYGGVTSLFVLEDGSVTDQTLNNIKYIVDGVIELKVDDGRHRARVVSMKWSRHSREWVDLDL